MVTRRTAVFGSLVFLRQRLPLAAPLGLLSSATVHAQTPDRMYRLALVAPSLDPIEQMRTVVLPELERLGFAVGRNLIVTEHVGLSGDMTRVAMEAIATRPDVALASTMNAVNAIIAASPTVPIVMSFIGENPVALGLAQSYSRPGGRVTGFTIQAHDLDGKRLALLKEALPSIRSVAIIAKRPPRHVDSLAEMGKVAKALGIDVEPFYADAPSEYAGVLRGAKSGNHGAAIFAAGPEFVGDAKILAGIARDVALPTIGEAASMARDGMVLGYGPNRLLFRRRAADYVARILRGTPPGVLPIEQPSEFELAVNLVSARAMGFDIPSSILVRADEVFE